MIPNLMVYIFEIDFNYIYITVTSTSLVMLQRHRRIQARYETLVRDVNSRDIEIENSTGEHIFV